MSVQILPAAINDLDQWARSDCTWARLFPPAVILPYAVATAPSGFLNCDGASYPTASYPSLFSAIGYTFGGSGANFNVPNMSGRVPIGIGTADGPTIAVGTIGGESNHTLSVTEMPAHAHTATSTQGTHTHGLTSDSHSHSIASGQFFHTHSDNGHVHTYAGHTHPTGTYTG